MASASISRLLGHPKGHAEYVCGRLLLRPLMRVSATGWHPFGGKGIKQCQTLETLKKREGGQRNILGSDVLFAFRKDG